MTAIESYTQTANEEKTLEGARILVVPNFDVAQSLTQFHADRGYKKISIADCISREEQFLPMPDLVFERLLKKINSKPSIVTGLYAYFVLLEKTKREMAFARLRAFVDNSKLHTVIIVSSTWKNDLEKIFKNPRYKESQQLVYIDGDCHSKNLNVVLVDERWIKIEPPVCGSFRDYLVTVGNFPTSEDKTITVALPDNDRNIAGLDSSIKQIHLLADFMRQFCKVQEPLPETILQWILDKTKELKNKDRCLEVIQHHFFPEGLSDVLKTALKRFSLEEDETTKEVMLWMLRNSVKEDSYLHRILKLPQLTADNFLLLYIAPPPDILVAKNINFCEERSVAIKELAPNRQTTFIPRFVEQTKDLPAKVVLPWLNNKTKEEHVEIIRRFAELTPNQYRCYPELQAYLSEYDYGDKRLTDYFARYRKFKLLNDVTEDFCKEAFDIFEQENIQSRDLLLQQFNANTALLVVDAMSAEYLPFIIHQAGHYHLRIEKHCVCYVNLPTSTAFNKINWNGKRLSDIKALDKIVHHGIELHHLNTYDENITEELDKILPQIFNILSQHIHKFDRIILTSDHGASRLAVRANELNLARTLDNPSHENPDDWRYIKKPNEQYCPDEFEETLDGRYWIVRGYNRLPKQGGKQYELHGGATPEERLVPFVVFSNIKGTKIQQPVTDEPIKQIKERDDFDI